MKLVNDEEYGKLERDYDRYLLAKDKFVVDSYKEMSWVDPTATF